MIPYPPPGRARRGFCFLAALVAAATFSLAEHARPTGDEEERIAVPSSEGYVTTPDGVRLFFRRLGSGPRAVLIPNGIPLARDFAPLAEGRTLVFYDLRNRGRSDAVADATKLKRGLRNDVDDLEAVRLHLGLDRASLIGHSYVGLTAILYALEHPDHVDRVVQIGPMEPFPGKTYPDHLSGNDATLQDTFAALGRLQAERGSAEPEAFCRKFWAILRVIFVTDPAHADRIDWGRCELPNERGFMKYWTESLLPSIKDLRLGAPDLAKVRTPVLTVHGRRDRNAPYGGGREWALLLGNARLLTVDDAAHAPWIEAPDRVLGAIGTFLDGAWPGAAEVVE